MTIELKNEKQNLHHNKEDIIINSMIWTVIFNSNNDNNKVRMHISSQLKPGYYYIDSL